MSTPGPPDFAAAWEQVLAAYAACRTPQQEDGA
jgi:hypothetical protein